jgi:hypothetical protein
MQTMMTSEDDRTAFAISQARSDRKIAQHEEVAMKSSDDLVGRQEQLLREESAWSLAESCACLEDECDDLHRRNLELQDKLRKLRVEIDPSGRTDRLVKECTAPNLAKRLIDTELRLDKALYEIGRALAVGESDPSLSPFDIMMEMRVILKEAVRP